MSAAGAGGGRTDLRGYWYRFLLCLVLHRWLRAFPATQLLPRYCLYPLLWRKVWWTLTGQITESTPAIITALVMPLSFSVANGIGGGLYQLRRHQAACRAGQGSACCSAISRSGIRRNSYFYNAKKAAHLGRL